MQNLFVKILVLGSVIGSSCFVVWQAHDGLKTVADKVDPGEFVALPENAPAAVEKSPEALSAWEHPLQLADSNPEPMPTLAAPSQSESGGEEVQSFDPLAAAPAPGARQHSESKESGLPMLFDDRHGSDVAQKQVPAELPEIEPRPTLRQPDSNLAMKSEVASREFVELPDQQVERPESGSEGPTLALTEPTPTLAASGLPSQTELEEMPPARFGPSAHAESLPELPAAPSPLENSKEMPGLTKLPPSHPGPVLLPIEPREASESRIPDSVETTLNTQHSTPNEHRGAVITADAVESELEPVQKASGTVLPDAPREFIPGKSAPLMPAELPVARTAEIPSKREMPAGDPFSSDPFGSPAAPRAAVSEPVPTLRSPPEQLPEVMPAGGVRNAGGFEPQSRSIPEQFGVQQIAGEQPAATAGPLPPLPPTGEVLPDIVPGAPRGAEPPAAIPTPAIPNAVIPAPVMPNAVQPNEVLPLETGIRANDQAKAEGSRVPQPGFGDFANSPVMPPAPATVTPAATPTPNQLIGTAEFDSTAPRGPQSPELKIEKIAPTEAEVGESVIYAIIIRNVGGSEAKDVVVEDRIPRGAQLEGTIPQAYLNEGKLSWQLGTIESGGERKIQLKVVPIEAGQIGSVATVSFASTVSASIKVNAPKLTIDMSGPSEVVFGEPMNFRFILRNQGQGVAKSVFLRAMLPPGLKHPGGNDLEYESGTMAPGAEKIIDLAIQAEREGVYAIHAQVNNDGKTHGETGADINVIKSRLELSRTGTENRFVGRPASFILKISNTSSELLKGITVQEKLAPGVELTAIPGGGRWDPRTRLLTWKLDEIPAGEAREISVLYMAKTAGEHVGKLVAVDDAGNQCSLETHLLVKGFAELTPDYKADQRTVLVNERVTLQMSLKNAGTAAGRNIRATFILPEGVDFVSARGPVEHQVQGNQVIFQPMNELPIGAEETFHLAVLTQQAGTSKITLKLESDDYAEPVFQDQAIRVIAVGQ